MLPGFAAARVGEHAQQLLPPSIRANRAPPGSSESGIYSVLALCLLLTALLFVSFSIGGDHPALENFSYHYQTFYYFGVAGDTIYGVIGTGVYPIGGTRIWCRNFCPMAALLGLGRKREGIALQSRKTCASPAACVRNTARWGLMLRLRMRKPTRILLAPPAYGAHLAEVCPRVCTSGECKERRDPQEQFVRSEWGSIRCSGSALMTTLGSHSVRTALVIPALNEEEVIGETLVRIPPGVFSTVMVVDNGLSDRTAEDRTLLRGWTGAENRYAATGAPASELWPPCLSRSTYVYLLPAESLKILARPDLSSLL